MNLMILAATLELPTRWMNLREKNALITVSGKRYLCLADLNATLAEKLPSFLEP